MKKSFTATLSKSPGRRSWAVIFRHPLRLDSAEKPGRRVRRGLGTENREEAQRLVDQLSALLAREDLWSPSSRAVADRLYDARVVAAFYDGLAAEDAEAEDVREEFIPLPTADEGYRHVLVLGTTGAGKTTLVRQLIGVDLRKEPFPSTSTAKTTVADLELVVAPGDYEVVATFLSRGHVRELIEECLVDAALAASRGTDERGVLRRVLFHAAQRFRLAYVLGNVESVTTDDGDIYEDEDSSPDVDLAGLVDPNLESTRSALTATVADLREMVVEMAATVRRELPPSTTEDEKVLTSLFEEALDKLLRESARFDQLVDRLLWEVSERFDALATRGDLRVSSQRWPTSWTWKTTDRAEFIRLMCLLVGNDAKWFGRLLTPLVNGVRVKGPFKPKWSAQAPKLVLFDGEGLGHTPDTALSVPTHVLERFEAVDSILLVDNAEQPMQAVPVAILRSLSATGFDSKLHLVFTHLDQVKGPNLPTDSDRRSHVRASLDNAVLRDIGTRCGRSAERALTDRLNENCYFVGSIHRTIDPQRSKNTLGELVRLVRNLQAAEQRVPSGPSKPIYDRAAIVMNVQGAALKFHQDWTVRLRGEHWTRVRALSRRLAENWADHYDTLDPVGDLVRELTERMRKFLDSPLLWDPPEADDAARSTRQTELAQALTMKLVELGRERIWRTHLTEWNAAYSERGTGSAYRRARIIKDGVYTPGVPVVSDVENPDAEDFLAAVRSVVEEVFTKVGAELR